MASKYDHLDAVTELEQVTCGDLKGALEPRGCTVVHHGTSTGHAPGGRPDIEIRDPKNGRLIHVQVTKRKGTAADGEFLAVTDHLEKAIAAGGYKDYCCFFVSPGTSARMALNIRNRHNLANEQSKRPGRIIPIDFGAMDLLASKLASSDPKLYPASRLGALFARWPEAVDDARTRRLIAEVIFSEDHELLDTITEDMKRRDAARELQLKRSIESLENRLREHGITGNHANTTLIYLTFLRLYEEKRESEGKQGNRFTNAGFAEWTDTLAAQLKAAHKDRLVEILLREIAQDPDLQAAGLLQVDSGQKQRLHHRVTDALVQELVLPVFDEYQFYRSSVDVLGVVFETLARRGEKDTRVGQFFTPQEVVNFCADVVDLSPRDVALDPAVGTARFLIAAMDRMVARASELPTGRAAAERSIKKKQLLGIDLDEWVATIAKMNMYIHGDGKSNIYSGNGLILADRDIFAPFAKGLREQVDVVLTNPPLGKTSFKVALDHWSLAGSPAPTDVEKMTFLRQLGTVPMRPLGPTAAEKKVQRLAATVKELTEKADAMSGTSATGQALEKARRRRDGAVARLAEARNAAPPPALQWAPEGETAKGGALFLGAICEYLKRTRHPDARIEWQGGATAIIVDEAILNTDEYADARSYLRRRYFIKAVVSLGRQAFKYLAHTDAKTSILYLIRKPNDSLIQQEPVFFAHAERIGYSATGRWVGSELPQVLVDYRAAKAAVLSAYHGALFDPEKCQAALSTLKGWHDRWRARRLSGDVAGRLDFYYARYLDLSEALHASGATVVTLGELIQPRSPLASPDPSITSEYEFAVVKSVGVVDPKGIQEVGYRVGDLWCVEEGDIVVSGIDLVRGSAAVAGPEVDGLVMSKEMFPYRVVAGAHVLPEYVALLLRTKPVRDMILGWVSGTSNRTRIKDAGEILGIPVVKPPSEAAQQQAVALAVEAAGHRRDAELKLENATALVESNWPSSSS